MGVLLKKSEKTVSFVVSVRFELTTPSLSEKCANQIVPRDNVEIIMGLQPICPITMHLIIGVQVSLSE